MTQHTEHQHENENEASPVGHESDADFARLMDGRARKDGPAGLPDEVTVADDAPPVEMARQVAKTRIGVFKERMAKGRIGLKRTVAEAPGRMRQKLAGAALEATSIEVMKERLRECRVDVPHFAEVRDRIETKIAVIPFYRRGLVSVWVVAAVLGAVAVFDGAVMKSALDQTALDTTSIWLTTVGVALLFAAINEAFGLLLGVVVRRAGPRRTLLMAGVLAVGLVGLFASIAILGWFRHEVAVSQNHSLSEIAAGREASIDFIIDPLFLAPLQAVACISAMAVVAFYALSAEWRELRKRLATATAAIERNDADIARVEAEIQAAHQAGRASFVGAFDVEANAAAAQAEIACGIDAEKAMEEAETAMGDQMASRYKSERNSEKAIYDNGKVRRAARPTEFGRRSTHTPEACDIEVDEPKKKSNGHKENIDPRQVFFDVKGL
jgi:hypothetical protein